MLPEPFGILGQRITLGRRHHVPRTVVDLCFDLTGVPPAQDFDLYVYDKNGKEVASSALPAASIYSKVKFASIGQQTKAKELIAKQWPTAVGA